MKIEHSNNDIEQPQVAPPKAKPPGIFSDLEEMVYEMLKQYSTKSFTEVFIRIAWKLFYFLLLSFWVTPSYLLNYGWNVYMQRKTKAAFRYHNPYTMLVYHGPTLVMCSFFWSTLILTICSILNR